MDPDKLQSVDEKGESNESADGYTFVYPRAKELFERITSEIKDAEEVKRLADEVNRILGRPIRKNEFYYTGFGRRRGGQAEGVAAIPKEGEEAPAKEEKTTFDVKLSGFDAKSKIKVIKEVRAITSLGLKEAKELVEGAPTVVAKQLKKEEAEELKKKLEDVGAQIELV